jgi:hypothetical protein
MARDCRSTVASHFSVEGIRALFLLLFHIHDFTAFVMAAARANRVRQAHFAAVAALDQISSYQTIMGAPAIPASLRMFPLWMWGHDFLLV